MKVKFKTLAKCLVLATVMATLFACSNSASSDDVGKNPIPTPPPTPEAVPLKSLIANVPSGEEIDLSRETYTISDNDTYNINKPITLKNADLKNAKINIRSSAVVIENITGIDSIVIDKEVLDGDFTLSNCNDVNEMFVVGGGSNSIHISGTKVESLAINKDNVRIAVETIGKIASIIKNTYILSDCKIESASENTKFENLIIDEAISKIVIAGSGTIETVIAKKDSQIDASNTTIDIPEISTDYSKVATELSAKKEATIAIKSTYTLDLDSVLYYFIFNPKDKKPNSEVYSHKLKITDCFIVPPKKGNKINIKFNGWAGLNGEKQGSLRLLPAISIYLWAGNNVLCSTPVKIENIIQNGKFAIDENIIIEEDATEEDDIYVVFESEEIPFDDANTAYTMFFQGNDERPFSGWKGKTYYTIASQREYMTLGTGYAVNGNPLAISSGTKAKITVNSVKARNTNIADENAVIWIFSISNNKSGNQEKLKFQNTPQTIEIPLDESYYNGIIFFGGANAIIEVGDIVIE